MNNSNETMKRYSGINISYYKKNNTLRILSVINLLVDPNYIGYITQKSMRPTPQEVERILDDKKFVIFRTYTAENLPGYRTINIIFEESHPLYNYSILKDSVGSRYINILTNIIKEFISHEEIFHNIN
jgi:hypothetical protein